MGEPNIGSGKIVHEQHPLLKVPQKRGAGTAALAAAVLALGLLAGCAAPLPAPSAPVRDVAGDLVPENDEQAAVLAGKLDRTGQRLHSWKELAPALRASRAHIAGREPGQVAVAHGDVAVTWGDVAKTLDRLEALLPRLDAEPGLLAERFRWVKLKDGAAFSGYYEPVVKASRTRKPGYEQAIYALPPDMKQYKRRHKGRYHTRRQIEEQQLLAGRGLELAWAADPVDVFFLEIQGSGRLVFDDGTEAFINYAGQNGHKYKSSGRIMREKGLLKRGDIFEQRQWFKDNPQRVREILNENPSYVFFRYGSRGPTGAMGHVVDEWLSLAVDRSYIPLGAVVAFGVNVPDEKYGSLPLRGIGFAQDVGGAIKQRRIDLFCGGSERANYVASHLDAPGPAWVLVAR